MRALLSLAVMLGLLAWVAGRADLRRLPEQLSDVNIVWLGAAVVLRLASLLLRVLRFRGVLSVALGYPAQRAVSASFIGAVASQVLPFRGGEALRLAILKQYNSARLATLVATVALDRLLDLLAVCLGLALAIAVAPLPAWIEAAAMSVSAIAIVCLALVLFGRALATRVLARLPDPVEHWGRGFIRGLDVVDDRIETARWFGVGAAGWVLEVIAVAMLLAAFGQVQPWFVALLLCCATAVGMAVPAGPAGLGPHQAIVVAVLATRGVAAEAALALSLVGTLLTLLAMVLGALLSISARWDRDNRALMALSPTEAATPSFAADSRLRSEGEKRRTP